MSVSTVPTAAFVTCRNVQPCSSSSHCTSMIRATTPGGDVRRPPVPTASRPEPRSTPADGTWTRRDELTPRHPRREGSRRGRRAPPRAGRSSGSRVPSARWSSWPGRRRACARRVSAWRSDQAKTSTAAAIDDSATAAFGAGPGRPSSRRTSDGPGHVRDEHRRQRFEPQRSCSFAASAASRVLLVGGDRLVLDAVVGGQLAAAQREQRGREQRAPPPPRSPGPRGRDGAARSRPPPRPPPRRSPGRPGRAVAPPAARALTSGITASASARRASPRAPGTASNPRTRGLGPLAVRMPPSRARTAAAQCVGPWTSSPLRRAMPPRRSFSDSVTPAPAARGRGRSGRRSPGRARRCARRRRGSAERSRAASCASGGRSRRRHTRERRRGTNASR